MNIDLNKNGLIDMLEQQIQHASTSTISNFATVAKKASEIRDGANKCYFNKVNKCLVIKHGNTPMTDCLQFNAKNNNINNVNSVHFKDESTLSGVVDSMNDELTDDEAKMKVPSMNLLNNVLDTIDPQHIYNELDEIATKTNDISYNSSNHTTTISHNLQVNGNISSSWLDNEFTKYALLGHNHNSTYAPLRHNHEFANIYKQTTRTIMNETTNEEEEITETKTLQDVFDEKANLSHTHEFANIYKQTTRTITNETTNEEEEITETQTLQEVLDGIEQSLTTAINEKANSSHTHEFADIYKRINSTTTKTLQQVLTEYEQSLTTTINQGLNTKANIQHTHEISDIYKNVSVQNQDGTTTTTQQPLETFINEKDTALRTLINGKANSQHTHDSTAIVYKPNVNVKQELDTINSKLSIEDSNGNSIDILATLFGVGAVAGAVIDGGLVAAVATLQEEIALLQTQVAGLATHDLTSDVVDAVNMAGEVVEGGASIWKGLKGIANAFKQITTTAASYVNLAEVPLVAL